MENAMNKELIVSQPSSIETAERKFELLQRQATAMSKSELVPKEYRDKIPNCMIALEVADRVNASPFDGHAESGNHSRQAELVEYIHHLCDKFVRTLQAIAVRDRQRRYAPRFPL